MILRYHSVERHIRLGADRTVMIRASLRAVIEPDREGYPVYEVMVGVTRGPDASILCDGREVASVMLELAPGARRSSGGRAFEWVIREGEREVTRAGRIDGYGLVRDYIIGKMLSLSKACSVVSLELAEDTELASIARDVEEVLRGTVKRR